MLEVEERVFQAEERHAPERGAPEAPRTHVYWLIECPPMEKCSFTLLASTQDGLTILAMGRAPHEEPTLNLAMIRRLGATLGANEVRFFGRVHR